MRWNKLKRMAFDHPYFEYKRHLLSEEEAERILSAGYIGVDEFMQNVRARCEQPEAIPVHEEISIPQSMYRRRHIRGRLARRLAIACIVLFCLTAFLTLTKPGIALAATIRNFIVQIFDGSLNAQGTEHSSGLPPIDFENIPDTFSSLEEAARIIGRPVVDASGYDSIILQIDGYVQGDEGIDIRTKYITHTGKTYFVTQAFHKDNTIWGTWASTGEQKVTETILPNSITVYTGIFDDGTAFGEVIDNGMNIDILSKELTPGDILDIAREMRFIEP